MLFILLLSNLSPVLDYKEPEQKLMFISELEYVPASVEALVAQGTGIVTGIAMVPECTCISKMTWNAAESM